MKAPRVSLDQWRAFLAVVDGGGFAQAAGQMHRSQSTISYAVAKLQEQLGLTLFVQQGRRAVLTEAGQVLLPRARRVMADAAELEGLAETIERGWEPEIQLVVDAAFPSYKLIQALRAFAPLDRGTRVQLREVILSGAEDALHSGEAHLAIAANVPQGWLGEELCEVEFIAVAHPNHPLHELGRPLTQDDLVRETHVVIRDSGITRKQDAGWLGSEHRWTVSNLNTAVTFISHGLGFGWLPRHGIEPQLEEGLLLPLLLREGQAYHRHLYLVYGHPEQIGPATRQLAELISEVMRPTGIV